MPSNINTKFLKKNFQLIIFILFIFALILKLFLLFQTNFPIFTKNDIKLEFSNPENLELEIIRKKEIYHFSFVNQIERQVKITNLPNINFEVQREGEITEYKKNDKGIEIKVIPKFWGKTNILIKKNIYYKNLINIYLIISIILSLSFINKKNLKKLTYLSCLVFSFMYISIFIYQNIGLIFQKVDIKKYEYLYNNSQYIQGQGSKEVIGDDIIYSYAGYLYANGVDPSQIDFEHPPLAKYLYGINYQLFNNFNILNLVFYLISFFVFFLITKLFFMNKIYQGLSLVLFSVENTILTSIILVSLDLPLLLCLLTSYLFFLKAKNKKSQRLYFISSLFIGFAISSKIYFTGIIFLTCQFIDLFVNQKKDLNKFFISLIIIPIPFLLSYVNYFSKHNLIDFVDYQKYIFSWFMGKQVSQGYGFIFLVLIFGKFKAWWDLELGKIITITNHSVIWILQTLILPISIFICAKTKKINFPIIWSVIYLIFLSAGAMAENLLFIVLPFMSINFIKTLSLLNKPKTIKINQNKKGEI